MLIYCPVCEYVIGEGYSILDLPKEGLDWMLSNHDCTGKSGGKFSGQLAPGLTRLLPIHEAVAASVKGATL